MVTTIQLREEVKEELNMLKNAHETYEDVIARLIKSSEIDKRKNRALLREGYKEMVKESLRVTREWSSADSGWD